MFHLEKQNYYYHVYVDEENIDEFPKKLKNCAAKSLAISCELMGIKNIQFMSTSLQQYPEFTQFRIFCSFKQLKDAGIIELNKAFKIMNSLTVLRLFICNNSITDKGLNELSKTIRTLQKLQHLELHLSQNKIEGTSSFKNLANSLEDKKDLIEFNLDISSNSLSKRTNIKPLWNVFTLNTVQMININCSQNKISQQLFQQMIHIFVCLNGLQKYSIDIDLSKKQKMNRKQCLDLREQLRQNEIKCKQFKLNLDLIEFSECISLIRLISQLIDNRYYSVQYQIIFQEDQSNIIQQAIDLFNQYLKSFQRQIYTIAVYQQCVSKYLAFCQYQHLCDLYY